MSGEMSKSAPPNATMPVISIDWLERIASKQSSYFKERTGIPRSTPHSLRHTSITEAVHVPNSDVADITRVAGHKNLITTQRYIHTADERAHEAMAKLPKLATF